MRTVVAAVIERSDRRLLIGQRRRSDTSPLKWEFPGGKVERGETPEAALARTQGGTRRNFGKVQPHRSRRAQIRGNTGATGNPLLRRGNFGKPTHTPPVRESCMGVTEGIGQLRFSSRQCATRREPCHRKNQARRNLGECATINTTACLFLLIPTL